ncbi:hypothetical protein [Pelagibacterium limicola]|uniref:hypothetical protein n=1 Tax=Pelagibacterium limicola TaxID=2791022 RepID=UPI0018B001FA|nr:hypothetical protein [Pelagibacterium limicola]
MKYAAASLAIFALAGIASPAAASEPAVDIAIESFIAATGFARIDPVQLEESLGPLWLQTDLVPPSGPVGPIEKALLIATGAIPSTRTRTALSYGQLIDSEGDSQASPVSFIEVRHYNLASEIRDENIKAYGLEDVADLEMFGLGEHRAWRFVFQPLAGYTALLIDASTREIDDREAADHDCTGLRCLKYFTHSSELATWEAMDVTIPDWPRLYPDWMKETSTPAHAAAELAVLGFWANAESGTYQWTGGEHPEAVRGIEPFRFIGIDRNLGQEAAIDAIWIETLLNDTSISEIWFRRSEVAGDVYFDTFTIPR